MLYLIALVQHSLIGDYLTERGVRMLWPMSRSWYGAEISVKSPANIYLEWILFLTSLALLFKTRDAWSILEPHPSNLILFIPVAAICLFLLGFSRSIPIELMVPHLTY